MCLTKTQKKGGRVAVIETVYVCVACILFKKGVEKKRNGEKGVGYITYAFFSYVSVISGFEPIH